MTQIIVPFLTTTMSKVKFRDTTKQKHSSKCTMPRMSDGDQQASEDSGEDRRLFPGRCPQNGKMPGSQQAEEGTWDELEGYL